MKQAEYTIASLQSLLDLCSVPLSQTQLHALPKPEHKFLNSYLSMMSLINYLQTLQICVIHIPYGSNLFLEDSWLWQSMYQQEPRSRSPCLVMQTQSLLTWGHIHFPCNSSSSTCLQTYSVSWQPTFPMEERSHMLCSIQILFSS